LALFSNTTGEVNTAIGSQALYSNQTGFANTATGRYALQNSTGINNTADGASALRFLTAGGGNTAVGRQALFSLTGGGANTALGSYAGDNLTTGSNNIDIGNAGIAAESNIIRIGTQTADTDSQGVPHNAHTAVYIAGISGTGISGTAVKITSSGQLGVAPSSARFKDEIKPMEKASEAILALKPVTFHYKKEVDPDRTQQFGLVAEEVEKINPALVTRDAEGKVFTVRYEAVNAMLLNEFLKEHRKVQELEKKVEKLTAGLQKVGNELELRKPAPRTASSNH
jgi:hypothetical protein